LLVALPWAKTPGVIVGNGAGGENRRYKLRANLKGEAFAAIFAIAPHASAYAKII
jgi:hypothetical protein